MTYRITGLEPADFAALFDLDDETLAARSIVRSRVRSYPGAPCRISLDDAQPGATVLLLNHVSLAAGPYAATHAIYVSEGAKRAEYRDEVPPALARRLLSLRAFDRKHMMIDAVLAQPGEADAAIRRLFDNPGVAYIHAHNAARGCFAAAVERA
jgi:hypothetical protein